jgi:hypothetical protein
VDNPQKTNTGGQGPPVLGYAVLMASMSPQRIQALFLDFDPSSERAEQNGADKHKRGACSQHVELHGKIHEGPHGLFQLAMILTEKPRPAKGRAMVQRRE